MIAFETSMRQICGALIEAHCEFALVGGLAVSARTEPRFTRDIDIAVAVAGDEEAEEVIRNLRARDFEVDAVVEQDAVGRLATARLTSRADKASPVLDLLFASSGIEAEVVGDADIIELLPHLHVRVATAAHLIALKVLARDDIARPQDIGDLRSLLRVVSTADLNAARAALRLITERGYHRGRQLEPEFDELITS